MPRVAFLIARRAARIDARRYDLCLDRDVLNETSISWAERVPLSFLLFPPSPPLSSPYNHRVQPSRSRWNNRREGSEEPGDYELGMTQPRTHRKLSPSISINTPGVCKIPGGGDEVHRHTALSFSSLSGRPLESAERHPSLRASSVSTGDTLRGSEVGDVGGINQEDVLAKQGEEHVRDPLEINLSMFSVYRPRSFALYCLPF